MTFTLAKGKRIYGGQIVPRSLRKSFWAALLMPIPRLGPCVYTRIIFYV